MSFATRYGLVDKKPLQLTSIDEDLRHSLWNELDDVFNNIEKLSIEYYRGKNFHSHHGSYVA